MTGRRLASLLRGIDLGDDRAERARLEAQAARGELGAHGLATLGAIDYRQGRYAEAEQALSLAARDPQVRFDATLLCACAMLRRGEPHRAVTIAERLLTESRDGERASLADARHVRGDALWASGHPTLAEQSYLEGLSREASSEMWLEVARLRAALGEAEDALAAAQKSRELDENNHLASFFHAALLCESGDTRAAMKALSQAVSWHGEYGPHAWADRRFTRLRSKAAFAKLARAPKLPDLSWLDAHPALARLRDHEGLRRAGVRFVSRGTALSAGREARRFYEGGYHLGTLWSSSLWHDCKRAIEGKVLLARCPTVPSRVGYEIEGALYVDLAHPEQLLFAPSPKMPAALFEPLPCDGDAIAARLADVYPSRRIARAALSAVRRAFIGHKSEIKVPNPYTGKPEQAGLHELSRHFNFSPAVDPMGWGSSCDDDPWPDRIPSQPGLAIKQAATIRRVRQQRDGAVSSLTFRTYVSRSHLSFEVHEGGLYVCELRYVPAPTAAVVERYNARHDTSFPLDLPLDLLSALHGLSFREQAALEQGLSVEREPTLRLAYLDALCALAHSDLRVTRHLVALLTHDDVQVRRGIAAIAYRYRWEFLLEDMALCEPDRALRDELEQVLREGVAAPLADDPGEPAGAAPEVQR